MSKMKKIIALTTSVRKKIVHGRILGSVKTLRRTEVCMDTLDYYKRFGPGFLCNMDNFQ